MKLFLTRNLAEESINYNGFVVKPFHWYGANDQGQLIACPGSEYYQEGTFNMGVEIYTLVDGEWIKNFYLIEDHEFILSNEPDPDEEPISFNDWLYYDHNISGEDLINLTDNEILDYEDLYRNYLRGFHIPWFMRLSN